MTGPTNDALQVFHGTLPLVGTILLAQWKEGKRFDDFRTSLNKRIDDLSVGLGKPMDDIISRLDKLEMRVGDLEKALRIVR